MPESVPVPLLRGEEAIYFREAAAGRLIYQQCRDCRAAVFYPRVVCPACMSDSLEYIASAGRGTVYSYTTLHRPGHPAFANDVPYTVVLVDLDEGIRVLADIVDCDPEQITVGMDVEVLFEKVSDEFGVPRFRPAREQRRA